jgi:hypothetical protein
MSSFPILMIQQRNTLNSAFHKAHQALKSGKISDGTQRYSGKYIMADDLLFDPIFSWIEKNHIPLLAHLGEPRDCWLPLEAMTDEGDKKYINNIRISHVSSS